MTSKNSHSSSGRARIALPVRKFSLKLMSPDWRNRIFNMTKIAPEKMIAGSIYLNSMIKTIDFLMNKNNVTPARTSKIKRYQ
jgi:hypothetical protein